MPTREIKIVIEEGLVGSVPKATPSFPPDMSINQVLDILTSILHHITSRLWSAEKMEQNNNILKGGK